MFNSFAVELVAVAFLVAGLVPELQNATLAHRSAAMRTRRLPPPLCTSTRHLVHVPRMLHALSPAVRVLSPDELFLELLQHYTTNDWARPVTVAPSLRAAERPHGLLSQSLPSLNLTQKHTARLAALRAAYARTFARLAAAPPPPGLSRRLRRCRIQTR